MSTTSSAAVLLADIGGTHARFALSAQQAGAGVLEGSVRKYDVADFDSLEDAATTYLETIGNRTSRAVFAVAGRIEQGEAHVVNNPWRITTQALLSALGLAQLDLVNDFAAQSMSVPLLGVGDMQVLGDIPVPVLNADANLTLAVLGPGTGLGVGALLARQGRFFPLETEGGHIGFAPGTALEVAILQYLMTRFGHVSNERLVSGMGLVNLYQALAQIEGQQVDELSPEQITSRATVAGDKLCIRSVEVFCAIFGSIAGDVALMLGAWNGVYLAGGLSPLLLPWLRQGDFRRRFEAKGRCSPVMCSLPCMVITHANAGLLGAAAIAGES